MATSREEILEQVKGALSEKLGIDESEITEDASFEEDLGADSLDLVEVVMDLEDQFGLKIPTRTPASSRPSARRSTTSSRIRAESEAHAGRARARPPDRRAARRQARAGVHARLLGGRPHGLVRAP
jgi:acyl carrier protein